MGHIHWQAPAKICHRKKKIRRCTAGGGTTQAANTLVMSQGSFTLPMALAHRLQRADGPDGRKWYHDDVSGIAHPADGTGNALPDRHSKAAGGPGYSSYS